jgi:hypothetical protein
MTRGSLRLKFSRCVTQIKHKAANTINEYCFIDTDCYTQNLIEINLNKPTNNVGVIVTGNFSATSARQPERTP